MSTLSWFEANNAYLTASLRWLRLRLGRLVPEEKPAVLTTTGAFVAPLPASPEHPNHGGLFGLWRKDEEPAAAPSSVARGEPPPGPTPVPSWAEQTDAAAAAREQAANIEPPPMLLQLEHCLGLSAFERDTLLLCAGMEFDPEWGRICALAQRNPAQAYPTFGLALAALDDVEWEALAPHRPLRHARLLEINQPGALALAASPLRADERIVSFLKGLNHLDDRLAILLTPVDHTEPDAADHLADSQHAAVDEILRGLRQPTTGSSAGRVLLAGTDAGSKLAVAAQVSVALGRSLYRMDTGSLPTSLAENETLVRLWERESRLLGAALYVDAEELDGEAAVTVRRFLARADGLIFDVVRERSAPADGGGIAVEVERPTPAEQAAEWFRLLAVPDAPPEAATETAGQLAGQFNLNFRDIARISTRTTGEAGALPALAPLWDGCRELTQPRLDQLAQRLEPKATWDDLVMPADSLALLEQIAGQVHARHQVYGAWGFGAKMSRGLGISVLFAGESGTGKTMAAEVLANALRLNLYRIDLSAVVSKYIGETEKNLRRLFDAAEHGGVGLFFDEADALFGRRSEVKDSHDRHANIEVNYLLQRMEAFQGLAILATNMKSALDPAFMRRLRFVVNFQFPGIKERGLIWRKALPPETPRDELDFDRLARLSLTGGNIHSIALAAAFMAAQHPEEMERRVTMALLLQAVRTEMRKLDKPIPEAELR